MDEPLTILVAARDEEDVIGSTVAALRRDFPDAEVIVADDGSRDGTADAAEEAGAIVLRLPRRGKGQALSLAERAAPPGRLLLVDADLSGELRSLLDGDADLNVAVFAERIGGGFGIAKRVGRKLIGALGGIDVREPLSGQRAVSAAARSRCFPVAAGFGCEVRMTIDAARAGLRVRETDLSLRHRPTGRDVGGFVHRARQLVESVYACGPLGVNFRGLALAARRLEGRDRRRPSRCSCCRNRPRRRPLERAGTRLSRAPPQRANDRHPEARRHSRNRPDRDAESLRCAARRARGERAEPARHASRPRAQGVLAAAVPLQAPVGIAVLLLPYDLREMAMLGDAGSNALGAMLGLNSVERFTERGRWVAISALAGFTILGERTSIGRLIEQTPGLSWVDGLGRA